VARLLRPASCQPHVVLRCASQLSDSNHGMETAQDRGDTAMQLMLFGGHAFRSDRDHHWLQRLTTDPRCGSWRVEDLVTLFTQGVLYYTATIARLPVHYLRRFVVWISPVLYIPPDCCATSFPLDTKFESLNVQNSNEISRFVLKVVEKKWTNKNIHPV